MAASYNFRSAFNGFNREDVVHYIEYMNSKHTNSLNLLKADLAGAQQENERLRAKPQEDAQKAELESLRSQLAEVTAQRDSARAELEEVTRMWEDAQKELSQVTAQRDAAMAEQVSARRRSEEELEAYRRAERMERQAKERADALYQKANGVLADATCKVEGASNQIGGIADQVAAQLAVLQEAVSGSKLALREAAATLCAIRPGSDE